MKPRFNLRSRLTLGLSTIALALAAPSAFSATETFNTAGTFNWVCPGGVTSIQVECWGGGGAGGAGRKDTTAGTNTSQNGGGGGGGAYARRVAVPVTAGQTYTITIPAAAVSGANGTTTNGQGRVNGSNVTFVGDGSVTVTAAGGQGGANAYTTANATISVSGATGGTTAASVGDVGGLFAGGAGSASNTGATNVSGSGGGGAGNANPGGAGVITASTTTAGAGGLVGGGAGGAGRDGGNTNAGVGAPGTTPGGGGGGGHNQGISTRLGGTGGLGQITITYTDPPPNFKDNDTDNLNLASSWTSYVPNSGNTPAEWNNIVTGANTVSLGADLAFSGIKISDPGGPVTINAGNTLTLGAAAIDLDLSAATQDLTVNSNLALSAANVWDVATTRALNLGGAVSGAAAVTKQGLGTATLSGLSNTPASNYSGTTTLGAGTLALTTTSPSLTGGLTFGATASTLDLSGVASSATFAGAMLVQTNSTVANTIMLGAAKTLTINGGMTLSNNTDNAETRLTMTGGGALVVNGASITVGNNTAGANISSEAHLNLSALDSFTSTLSGNLTIQASGDNSGTDPSSMTLSNVANSITAAAVRVGNSSTGSANTLLLGSGTNVIQTDLINLGAGTRDSGIIDFAGSGGSVTLRNVAGTGRVAAVNLGVQSAQTTGYTTNNLIDVTGNTTDIAIGTFATSLGAKSAANTNNLRFDTGTLDIRSLNMAFAKGTGTSTNRITIGGGTVRLGGSAAFSDAGTGTLTLATAGTGDLLINGGTVTSTANLLKGTGGTGTASVTLNGGTLDMTGQNIGSATDTVVLAAQSGTLQNLAELNGGAALTKTTAGTLVLTGTNTYTGGTNVNAGTLLLSGAFNMPATGTLQVNAGGTFSLADGTASATTTTAALGLTSGATLTFDWNGSNLDMLTSTAAATTAGAVGISINATSPTGSGGTLISSPLGGLSGAGYFLVNNIDFTAPVLVTDTDVSLGTITTGLTPLTDAYWLGGQLPGSGVGAMTLSTGVVSNWATDAAGTSAGGLVPGGSAVNVIFGASAATEQASVTTGGNLNLGSITFNDSAAVTIGGSHTITLNSTSSTAATSSGSGTTVTPGSAISVTSSANAANAINANLTLATNQTWNVASGKTLSVSGAVGGSGSLSLADAGSVTLAGANSYTGTTSISAGTLSLTGPLNGGGAISTSGTGALTQTPTGIISGASSFTQGSAALTSTLSATNTYTGDTTVSAGTLEITGTGSLYGAVQPSSATAVTVATGAQITLGGVATNNVLGFGANMTWAVSGTINSTGGSAQTLPKNVALNNGTLTGIASIAPNEQYGTFFSGTTNTIITANGATNTISAGKVGMASGSTLTLATPLVGDALAVSSALGVNVGGTQVAGALTKTGLGTVTLSGTNIYTGATTVSAGTLTVAPAGSITTTGNILLNVSGADAVANIDGTYTSTGGGGVAVNSGGILNTSGTVAISGANNQAILLGTSGGSGTWNVTGGSVSVNYASNGWGIGNTGVGTLNVSAGSVTTAGTNVLNVGHGANGTGILTVSGTGLVTVDPGSNAFRIGNNATSTGTVNLDGGTLSLGRNVTTVAGSTSTFNFNGGLLQAGLSSATYMTGLTTANVRNGGAKIDTNSFDVTIGQALLHSTIFGDNATDGGLTKSGAGTLTLTGSNTYNGSTLVSGGALQLNGAAAGIPTTSGITVNNGGTLGFTSGSASTLDLTGKPLSLGGTLTFDIGSTGVNDSTTVNDFTLTANSAISINPIGALDAGASYTVLTSTNPIVTGGFTLSGQAIGKLTLTPTVNTNTVTITPILDEGIWNQTGGGDWSIGNPGGPNAPNWNNYKPTVAGDAALFGSFITAPSTIIVDSAHTVGYMRFDNAANAYTIGTIGSSNLILDNGSAPALVAVTSGSHVIAENVALTSNLLAAPLTGTTLTVSGNLSGTGKTLQKVEGGTLELSGTANSHTGTTTVSAGTLSLTGSLTGGGAVTVNGNGVLSQSSTGVISGAATVTHASSGTSTLEGINTYTGVTAVSSGTLVLSGNRTAQATAGFSVGNVTGSTGTLNVTNGTFTVGTSGSNFLVGNGTASTGILNQSGGSLTTIGNQLLVGNATATGTYNLSGGTLTTIAGSLGVTVGVNTGTTGTFNLSGTGTLTMPATSTLQITRSDGSSASGITGTFTQTGGTATVGILQMGGGTAGGGNNNANNNATLNLSAGTFNATTFNVLSGANNSSSTINISGTADVTLPAFPTTRGSGATATINFDGGTLKPKAASATYMGGLTNAFIKAGGATFDTTGFDITVTQDLLTDGVSTGGGLTKAGSNTLTLAGTNTYTGGTTITGGVLSVTNANALGSGDVTFDGGTRLLVATGLDVANDIIIGTNTGASGNGMIQAGSAAGTATVSGAITINNGAAAGGHFAAPSANTVLDVLGPITSSVQVSQRLGTVRFSGGGTGYASMIATGITIVGTNNGIATTAAVTIGGSAACTLDLNGFNQSLDGIIKGGSAATIGNSSTTADSTLTTTGTSSFAGIIQDVVSPGTRKVNLAVSSGALTLTGANTFSGDITVANGTLVGAGATNSPGITVFGSRSNTRTITVNNGGTLQFDSGNVLGANHTATTAPTLVINSGGVVTNGSIATNNALNDVQLNGGTLTSTTGHTGSTPPNLPVYGAWNLNGAVTSTGTSTISTSDPSKGWVMLKVVGDKTTDFNVTSGTLTVSAPVVDNPDDSNIGSLSKSGAGAMILSGTNTYTGNTTVNAGTLELAATGQLKFALGATSGVNNSITGTTATLKGSFVIDTTAADALTSGTWTLENIASLTGPAGYDATFTVSGFTDAGSNKWTKTAGSKKYTFDETTGILTLETLGYAAWATLNGAGANLDDDHDNDGVSNGVEYFIGGAAGNTTGFTPLPGVTNTLGTLSITWTKGATYTGTYGTDFVVETSSTLAGAWAVQSADPTPGFTVTFPTANEVKYTFPAGTTNFARLKVTGP